eukprot:1633512-Rhodomonas_salina.1
MTSWCRDVWLAIACASPLQYPVLTSKWGNQGEAEAAAQAQVGSHARERDKERGISETGSTPAPTWDCAYPGAVSAHAMRRAALMDHTSLHPDPSGLMVLPPFTLCICTAMWGPDMKDSRDFIWRGTYIGTQLSEQELSSLDPANASRYALLRDVRLRAHFAMSGTDVVHSATPCPVLTQRTVLSDVQY